VLERLFFSQAKWKNRTRASLSFSLADERAHLLLNQSKQKTEKKIKNWN
jgi:hypothetical protein